MEFELTWAEPSLLVCRTSGEASLESAAALMQAIFSHPEYHPGVKVLIDNSELDVTALSAGDVEELAVIHTRAASFRSGHLAIVGGVNSPVRYGLGDTFEALTGPGSDTQIEVFETFDAAMAWLQGDDAASDPPAP